MSDLFQLGDQYAQAPETAQIFAGVNSEVPLLESGGASILTTPTMLPTESQAVQNGTHAAHDSGTSSPPGLKTGQQEEGEYLSHQHLCLSSPLLHSIFLWPRR